MAVDQGLVEWVTEALEPIGAVTMRRMMGGATLYLDGSIFAIVHDSELWIKADVESNAVWDAAGYTERFTVSFSTGMTDTMNYRRAPADVYDDAMQCANGRRWGSRRGCGREEEAEEALKVDTNLTLSRRISQGVCDVKERPDPAGRILHSRRNPTLQVG